MLSLSPSHQFNRLHLPCPNPLRNPNPNPRFCTRMYTSYLSSPIFTSTIHSSSPFHFPSRTFISPNSLHCQLRFRNYNVHASPVAGRINADDLSPSQPPANHDDYAGWDMVDSPIIKRKNGLPAFVIAGVGTSVIILIAAISHFSLSRKGFRLHFGSSLNALHGILMPSATEGNREPIDVDASSGYISSYEANPGNVFEAYDVAPESAYIEKVEHVIVAVPTDSTQEEALSLLKKLKIVEDDVKGEELCTRREFARWLARANLVLERNPKYRIFPSSVPSITAFDDISVGDPDFGYIQALAEAGVILSKLAGRNSEGHRGVYFSPDSNISRQDLIDWKTQLDYKFKPAIEEEISRTKIPFMDVREINADASPGFFMDVLASDKGILRKVYGQLKRFQPNKPSTKAQAAVALTSGRMTKAIRAELSRLEAENNLRQLEIEEIKTELLDRGDIENFWHQKLKEEINHGIHIEKAYLEAISDLEQEKTSVAEFLKEKAVLDSQRQLLKGFKEEVDVMSERLESERANFVNEQPNVKKMLSEMLAKQDGLLDAKSVLEAEKEAVQILRSWVEEEARKSQARAEVLEKVTRRWRWESQD